MAYESQKQSAFLKFEDKPKKSIKIHSMLFFERAILHETGDTVFMLAKLKRLLKND